VATDPLSQASTARRSASSLRRDLAPATPRARSIWCLDRRARRGIARSRTVGRSPPGALRRGNAQVGTYAATAPLATWRLLPESDAYATGTVTCAASLTNAVGPLVIDPAAARSRWTTERTMGGFAEEGRIAAGALTVTLRGAPATVW
jgi:hypothetical protein